MMITMIVIFMETNSNGTVSVRIFRIQRSISQLAFCIKPLNVKLKIGIKRAFITDIKLPVVLEIHPK